MQLAGLDLAWQGEVNASGLAVGRLDNGRLYLEQLAPALLGMTALQQALSAVDGLSGIAIDAPLMIPNATGQRQSETQISRDYGARKAGCHPSNQSLYPDALSVKLSTWLQRRGFAHLYGPRWQLECYPHPSIIECFGLPERLLYKKGRVAEKRLGQLQLAGLIQQLEASTVLPLHIPAELQRYLSAQHILSLKGRALKSNEDALDAIICLYIAALYQQGAAGTLYGDADKGYTWVPTVRCV